MPKPNSLTLEQTLDNLLREGKPNRCKNTFIIAYLSKKIGDEITPELLAELAQKLQDMDKLLSQKMAESIRKSGG